MEYLQAIAEDVSWLVIDNRAILENMSQEQLKEFIFNFLKNQ